MGDGARGMGDGARPNRKRMEATRAAMECCPGTEVGGKCTQARARPAPPQVTMFEAGKLPDESIGALLTELANVNEFSEGDTDRSAPPAARSVLCSAAPAQLLPTGRSRTHACGKGKGREGKERKASRGQSLLRRRSSAAWKWYSWCYTGQVLVVTGRTLWWVARFARRRGMDCSYYKHAMALKHTILSLRHQEAIQIDVRNNA
jgi:hypothetical protein